MGHFESKQLKNIFQQPTILTYHLPNMKINKYILQQRQQHWKNYDDNKLLEIKPTQGEWKQSLKKTQKEEITLSRLRIGHTRITHSYLLEGKKQPMCYACQSKYT